MRARYLSLRPLILWRQVARPLNWVALFGRDAPRELEIGCGNGDYLVARAREHPERDFVGIEIEWESVCRALRRVAQAGISNIRLLLGHAIPILAYAIAPEIVRSHLLAFSRAPGPNNITINIACSANASCNCSTVGFSQGGKSRL
jgi:tRNA G46 methylase TrmB